MKIKVFDTELKDGLGEAIAKNNSLSYCVKAEKLTFPKDISTIALAKYRAVAEQFNLDLYYPTKSILATTSWNKNDDVFGPLETWGARYTPVHSPTNIDHDHKQVVGHITASWVIDAVGNLLDDETKEEDLPDKFHLCNSAVIYRYSRESDFIARAEKLIEEIEEGKKFVSMECLFPNFSYALISPENEYSIVERNENTAFLTKHLRIYGGQGSYNGYKIGRFLKDMVFSGKGYVDEPANPESIIFDSDASFEFSKASHEDKWFEVQNKTIVAVPEMCNTKATNMENELMSDEAKKIEELTAQVANLQKQLTEVNAKALQEKIAELEAEVTTAKSETEAAKKSYEEEKKKVEEKEKAAAELNSKIETLTTANTELTAKVQEAEANKIYTDRVSTLVEGGIEKSEAEAQVKLFANLNDEQFKAVATVIVQKANANKTDDKTSDADASGDTVLTTAQVTDSAAGSVVSDSEEDQEAENSVVLSIAKRFGFVEPNTDGEK